MHAKILSLIKMFPCILLSMVAFYQYHRVHSSNLNPWKGGGFGMFSSINPVYKRKLSVSLVAADGKVVRIPLDSIVRSFSSASEVAQLRAKLIMKPSYERVKQMASTLATSRMDGCSPIQPAQSVLQRRQRRWRVVPTEGKRTIRH